MTKPTCKDCRFWETLDEWNNRLGEPDDLGSSDPDVGACHRYPPTKPGEDDLSEFPEVHKNEWCGEFKPRATERRWTGLVLLRDVKIEDLMPFEELDRRLGVSKSTRSQKISENKIRQVFGKVGGRPVGILRSDAADVLGLK